MPDSADLLTLREFLQETPPTNTSENTAMAAVSRHEGIRCDVCGKMEFIGRRYKCLRCENYDLCGSCRDKKAVNNRHTVEHAMQCILSSSALAMYFGSAYTPFDKLQAFTCPHCALQGFEHKDLLPHLERHHCEQSAFLVWCPICVCGDDTDLSMTDDLLEHVVHEHDPNCTSSHLPDDTSQSTIVASRRSTNSERLLVPPRHRGRFRTTIINSTTGNHDIVRVNTGGSLPRPTMMPPSQEFSVVSTLPDVTLHPRPTGAMSNSPSFVRTHGQFGPRSHDSDFPRLTTPPRASTPAPPSFRDRLRERQAEAMDEPTGGRGWTTGLNSLNARLRAAWADNVLDLTRPRVESSVVSPTVRVTPGSMAKNATHTKKKAQSEKDRLLIDSLLDGASDNKKTQRAKEGILQQERVTASADRNLLLQDVLLATLQKDFSPSSVDLSEELVLEATKTLPSSKTPSLASSNMSISSLSDNEKQVTSPSKTGEDKAGRSDSLRKVASDSVL